MSDKYRETCAYAAGVIRVALESWQRQKDADYIEATLKGLLGALDEELNPKLK